METWKGKAWMLKDLGLLVPGVEARQGNAPNSREAAVPTFQTSKLPASRFAAGSMAPRHQALARGNARRFRAFGRFRKVGRAAMGAKRTRIDRRAAFGARLFEHLATPRTVQLMLPGQMGVRHQHHALPNRHGQISRALRIGAERTRAGRCRHLLRKLRLRGRHQPQFLAQLPNRLRAQSRRAATLIHRERRLTAPHPPRKRALAEMAALTRLFDLAAEGLHEAIEYRIRNWESRVLYRQNYQRLLITPHFPKSIDIIDKIINTCRKDRPKVINIC